MINFTSLEEVPLGFLAWAAADYWFEEIAREPRD